MITLPWASAMLLMLAFGGTTIPAAAAELTINVSGARPSGKIFGQVFADAASFKAREKALLRFTIEPNGGTAHASVALPPGTYAIALFQDTKGTGRLETNFLGVPVVPYGFSNDARGSMGPPGFDAAAFTLGSAAAAVAIQLR